MMEAVAMVKVASVTESSGGGKGHLSDDGRGGDGKVGLGNGE